MGHEGHDDHDHPHHHGHGHDHHHHGHKHDRHDVPHEHREHAQVSVAAWAITCSDTRTPAEDESGKVLRAELEKAGHTVAGQQIVKDDAAALRAAIEHALEHGARAIVISGGTGIARRDVAVETVGALFEKALPGFGELFRMLSFEEIGSAAWLSRAAAGTYRGALIFALPGSPNAVRLALHRLILPELGHAVRELLR
ncbi:MAG: MogA/MoaB family molybdenum cofactor biosynthesis protein [Deltaproteobacteria bacterium]|nr:MogA/MoaB family molybdenum cofactor biosynthesis protein [Deltaproteobacteria bacterium]